ncbi:MAG: hypothetical protein ACRD2P_00745 [Terriglobia bacterium]
MATDLLTVLRSRPPGPMKIEFTDGESVIAEDITFLEEEGLVWYHLLRSNRPEKYESFDEPHLYSAKLSDILLCEIGKEEASH